MGDRDRHLDADELRRLADAVAGELGGEARSIEDLPMPPVRKAGPDEWRLPGTVEGEPFQRFTQSGPSWVRDTPGSRNVLSELALSPVDLTVYGSFPADPRHEPYVGVMVYQADWVDPAAALVGFTRIFSAPDSIWEETILGTNEVLRGTSATFSPMGTTYLWIASRALYQVVCPDPAYAARVADAITPFAAEGGA